MTSTNLFALQAALHARLAADTALTALLPGGAGGIGDHARKDAQMPYVVISALSSARSDTQATRGGDTLVTIDCYDRSPGMKTVQDVMAAISGALDRQDFAIFGAQLVFCHETASESFLAADGETRRGRQTFRLITEPTP